MCGRFTLAVDESELQGEFGDVLFPSAFAPRYNISPSQPVLAVPNLDTRQADFFVWGLIPSWAKDPSLGSRLINARAETLAEKPAFRGSLKHKRCLVLADGFYEWKKDTASSTKIPHYIRLADGKPFAFAGLWSEWRSADGSEVRSCTIITTTPNFLLASIHNRMPVILDRVSRNAWLQPGPRTSEELSVLLRPFPAEQMTAFPVSTRVNNPAHDDAACIAPA